MWGNTLFPELMACTDGGTYLGGMDHRDQLDAELDRRTRVNPGYSLRAFARDLGVAPSRVSEILNERRGVSEVVAIRMVDRLRWQGRRRERFLASVAAHHGRSAARRAQGAARLRALDAGDPPADYVVAWYGAALRVLGRLGPTPLEPARAARRLGLPVPPVRTLLRYLRRLGFVDALDRPATPERGLRVHAGQALARHAASDDPDRLELVDGLAIAAADLPAIRARLEQVHAELRALSERTEAPDRVVLLTSALCRVDIPDIPHQEEP